MRSIVVMAALLASVILVAASGGQAPQQGRAVFEGKGNCWTCHGRAGKGTPLGPDLSDGEWLGIDGSLESIRSVVRQGVPKPVKYPGIMPPMGGARLSRGEIDAVAAYVHALTQDVNPGEDNP
jgi:mono/diheme cytochrome c family protein